VEKVNFRTLVLRDLTGVVHVFPNGTITTLSNMTQDWSAYVFEIGVAYKENTDRVAVNKGVRGVIKFYGFSTEDDILAILPEPFRFHRWDMFGPGNAQFRDGGT
jgi:small-conductance mechanosensitive channel